MRTRRFHIDATKCSSDWEAIERATETEVVIRLPGLTLIMERDDAEKMERVGVPFVYVSDDGGRIVTTPVN